MLDAILGALVVGVGAGMLLLAGAAYAIDEMLRKLVAACWDRAEAKTRIALLEDGLRGARMTLELLEREVVQGRFDNATDEIETINLLLGEVADA